MEYGYDATGRLTSVKTDLTPQNTTDNQFYITGYTYDGSSYRIASVTQRDGSSAAVAMASFTYEQIGTTGVYRVKTVTDSSGTRPSTTRSPSRPRSPTPTVKTGSNVYDSRKRMTEIRMPAPTAGDAASTTKFEYDDNDNVIKVTDAQNKATVYTYDSNGNRILERDVLGNTVTRTYDAQSRLLTETRYRTPDPDGAGTGLPSDTETVRYIYDGQSRLRFVVTAEGRVSENRYTTGSYGLLE
ncbi:MAG: RHS repeat protein, partial [Nitrospira sp.]|nr:RHS repeat protein [Nitrospira sp.]